MVYADFLTVSHKNNILLFILKYYEIVKTETLYVDTDILELLIWLYILQGEYGHGISD